MINKIPEITSFLKKHYTPGTIDNHKLKATTNELLLVLFDIFPVDCIDTYELYEILTTLGYQPQKEKINEFYWCLLEND